MGCFVLFIFIEVGSILDLLRLLIITVVLKIVRRYLYPRKTLQTSYFKVTPEYKWQSTGSPR